MFVQGGNNFQWSARDRDRTAKAMRGGALALGMNNPAAAPQKTPEVVILSVFAKDLGTKASVTCHPRFFAEYRSE
jgi:hypothetical protein